MTAPTEVFNSFLAKVLFSPQSVYSHTLSCVSAFFKGSCIKQKRNTDIHQCKLDKLTALPDLSAWCLIDKQSCC